MGDNQKNIENRIDKEVFLTYRNGGIKIDENRKISVIVGKNSNKNVVYYCKIKNGNSYIYFINKDKQISINYLEMKYLMSNHITEL